MGGVIFLGSGGLRKEKAGKAILPPQKRPFIYNPQQPFLMFLRRRWLLARHFGAFEQERSQDQASRQSHLLHPCGILQSLRFMIPLCYAR